MGIGDDPSLANLASRIQLKKASILLVEPNAQGMNVLTQVLMGFGATGFVKAENYEEARDAVKGDMLDLIVCEASLGTDGPDGFDFISELRRTNLPNAMAPIIVVTAHTSRKNVQRARDCGAHFLVTKPLSPTVLLERVLWIAQANRPFVTCQAYAGPDRRFQNLGPPPNMQGRRDTDLTGDIGAAVDPNMSQDEIDSLLQPQRRAL
ncbi:MAG: two-component system response regulator [Phenylobacterium zucineum]|nr:MAG: two-component system response regulator [Phenylobacterium zucineum]